MHSTRYIPIRAAILVYICFMMSSCTDVSKGTTNSFDSADTIKLIQAILNDKQLKTEIANDFGGQPLKIVAGPVVNAGQRLQFLGETIAIVSPEGDARQIHERYPGKLYVGVPNARFIGRDSAVVSLLFYSGNATVRLGLTNVSGKWVVTERQNGKY